MVPICILLTTYYQYKKNATSTQQSSKLDTLNSSHAAQLFAKLYGCICSHTVVNRPGLNHFWRENVNENLLSSDACAMDGVILTLQLGWGLEPSDTFLDIYF